MQVIKKRMPTQSIVDCLVNADLRKFRWNVLSVIYLLNQVLNDAANLALSPCHDVTERSVIRFI